MKPFITPDTSVIGKKIFRFQCENIKSENIPKQIQDLSVVAYSMPKNHSFQTAYIFRLIFSNGSLLEFSSACTMVDGWHEVGSLNIRMIDQANAENSGIAPVLIKFEVPPFQVIAIEKLLFEDNDFCSECGIVICGEDQAKIIVATGILPGSVSIKAPFSTAIFEPEFPAIECKREFF